MRHHFLPIHALLAAAAAAQLPPCPRPVPFTAVRLDDPYLAPRIHTCLEVTIPFAFEQCEQTGRIANFARAGGIERGEFIGTYPFNDSDVFKVVEGAAYALALRPGGGLQAYVASLVAQIAAAQEGDGYLYTARTLDCRRLRDHWFHDRRWANLAISHELYNAGHLLEAACAHHAATGGRALLDVAVALADRIDADFGDEEGALRSPPGHQEIELGLLRLADVTGERRYAELARFFLEQRGRLHGGRQSYGEYSQDHAPVLEQADARGHAVRAAYQYAAMAEVARRTRDRRWIDAVGRLWRDVVGSKLYVTGGIGARSAGEAFGAAFELPNRTAYSETCAGIGLVLWARRMLELHGDAAYADVLERALYNVCLAGYGRDGKTFFYPNRLESLGGEQRASWFACACCPSNLVRFVPSIPGLAYGSGDDEVWVHLYAAGTATIATAHGDVKLRVASRYPWQGRVDITVDEAPGHELWLRLRIPGWATNTPVPGSDLYAFADAVPTAWPSLAVDGEPLAIELDRGYAVVRRTWRPGARIALDLPMPVRRLRAHAAVADAAGRVALQRGPLVYCVEGVDVADGVVAHLVLGDGAELASEWRPDLLGGTVVVTGKAAGLRRLREDGDARLVGGIAFQAVPYALWANRGAAPMAVWLAREPDVALPAPAPSLARRATARASHNSQVAPALADQLHPATSADKSLPHFHWWPRRGGSEWVEYEWSEPVTVTSCEVMWMRDVPGGGCDLPQAWRLLWRDGGQWRPVQPAADSAYETAVDRFCAIRFAPVTTTALRLEVDLAEGMSAAAHEWRVR